MTTLIVYPRGTDPRRGKAISAQNRKEAIQIYADSEGIIPSGYIATTKYKPNYLYS